MIKKRFREKRIKFFRLSISRNRCSISSLEVVLLKNGKKRKRSKIGAIFKKIWKGIRTLIELFLALDTLLDFTSFITNWFNW